MSEDRAGLTPEDDDLDLLDDLLGEETEELEQAESDELPPETEDDEQPEPPRRQPSRRQQATLRLRDRVREKEEEARQLREIVNRLSQTAPPQAAPDPYRQAEIERQEVERVAQMMPHEQAAYFARKTEQNLSNQLLRSNMETRDMLDRQAFATLAAQEPMAARLAADIERDLVTARTQGMNPTREALYNWRVGQEVRQRAKTQAAKQRRRGRAQIEAQTTRPGGAASTAAAARGRRADDNSFAAVEERLKNVTIGDAW